MRKYRGKRFTRPQVLLSGFAALLVGILAFLTVPAAQVSGQSGGKLAATFLGFLEDKVSTSERLAPDRTPDGTFGLDVTRSGSHRITFIEIRAQAGFHVWDTIGGNSTWGLGVTESSPQSPLLNNTDTSVAISMTDRRSLVLFAADDGSLRAGGLFDVKICFNASTTDCATTVVGVNREVPSPTATATPTGAPTVSPPTGSCARVPAGLVGWWPGDGHANDLVGGHNGTLQGGATFAAGGIAQAFSFDGRSGYVQVPNSASLDPTAEATFEAWVNLNRLPSSAGQIMAIVGKSGFGTDLDLGLTTDNRVRLYIAAGSNVASSATLQTGQWYHVAGTYRANDRLEIYVNGVLQRTTLIPGVTRSTNDGPLTIGESGFFRGRYFDGRIDEVSLYNRALSASEIRAIATAGSAGKCKTGIPTVPTPTPPTSVTPTPPRQPGIVTGEIRLSDGSSPPADQLRVQASNATTGQTDVPVTNGSFSLTLAPGVYQLNVLSQDDSLESPAARRFTLSNGQRLDLGTITLTRRAGSIAGRVLSGNAGVCGLTVQAIQAIEQSDVTRSARAVTDANGGYRLAVTVGRWNVSVLEGKPTGGCASNTSYRPSPADVLVSVGAGSVTQNLTVVAASGSLSGGTTQSAGTTRTLLGRIVANQTPIQNLKGGVSASLVGSDAPATTGAIVDGGFQINLTPGSYLIEVSVPLNGGYVPGPAQPVTIGDNQQASIELPVIPYDATIGGTIRKSDGGALTGEAVTVFASNAAGGAVEATSDPATGTYALRVAAGDWRLDVRPSAGSGYQADVSRRPQWTAGVASGQTAAADLHVAPTVGEVTGTTQRPNGSPLAGATIVIRKREIGKNPIPVASAVSDAAGRYTVRLPEGEYEITSSTGDPAITTGASTGETSAFQNGNPLLGPAAKIITVRPGLGSVPADLPFRAPAAAISGSVNLAGQPGEALVRAFSRTGAHTSVKTVNGRYTLDVVPGDIWTVDAVAEQGETAPTIFRSGEMTVDLTTQTSATADLTLSQQGALPPSFNWRFDPTQARTFKLGDGAEVIVPDGALTPNPACADKSLVFTVNARAERPQQQSLKLQSVSYEMSARDCFGPIAAPFAKPIRVRLPVPERTLGETQPVPAVYSALAKAWVPLVGSSERWVGPAFQGGGSGGRTRIFLPTVAKLFGGATASQVSPSALPQIGSFQSGARQFVEIVTDHLTEWSILGTGGAA